MRRLAFRAVVPGTLLSWVVGLLTSWAVMHTQPSWAANSGWPQWQGFKTAFVTEDGRVLDHSTEDLRTVSEGQAYALFFALVGDDKTAFELILRWTENNLAQGDLRKHLPAWHWGKSEKGWGVLDPNSASDADLWLVYTLLEASQRWSDPSYTRKAQALGDLILNQESLWVQGLGRSLLPGRHGFVSSQGTVKLNPSYAPGFILARLAQAWPEEGRWAELYLGNQQLLLSAHIQGQYPDWLNLHNGAVLDDDNLHEGDFDAIRVYLWLGLNPNSDPIQNRLKSISKPFTDQIVRRQNTPLGWNPKSSALADKAGPAGFEWAMRPLLQSLYKAKLPPLPELPAQRDTDAWRSYGYYSAALSLFAQGHLDGHFVIEHNGQLSIRTKGLKR